MVILIFLKRFGTLYTLLINRLNEEIIIKKSNRRTKSDDESNRRARKFCFIGRKKTGFKLELLSPETIKLLGSAKKDVDQDKDSENVLKLESVEFVLVRCNLVNNNYKQVSKVLFTFVPNKQFGQLITITLHLPTMLKTTNVQIKIIDHLEWKIM